MNIHEREQTQADSLIDIDSPEIIQSMYDRFISEGSHFDEVSLSPSRKAIYTHLSSKDASLSESWYFYSHGLSLQIPALGLDEILDAESYLLYTEDNRVYPTDWKLIADISFAPNSLTDYNPSQRTIVLWNFIRGCKDLLLEFDNRDVKHPFPKPDLLIGDTNERMAKFAEGFGFHRIKLNTASFDASDKNESEQFHIIASMNDVRTIVSQRLENTRIQATEARLLQRYQRESSTKKT